MTRKFEREECEEALRAYFQECKEAGKLPLEEDYDQWQKGRPDAPSQGPIRKIWKTWSRMRQDLQPTASVQRQDWTDDELLAITRDFLEFCRTTGSPPLLKHYEGWRKNHDAPTSTTIYQHLGPWKKVLRRADCAPG